MNIEDMLTLTCCQDHILTENIWFVWSETSYSGDKMRCYNAGRTDNEQLKIELLSQWKLEAEFRNYWSQYLCQHQHLIDNHLWKTIVMFPVLVIGSGSSEPQSFSDDSPELLSITWVSTWYWSPSLSLSISTKSQSNLNKVEAAPLGLFKHKVLESEFETTALTTSNLNLCNI